jgi:hypothetical protein
MNQSTMNKRGLAAAVGELRVVKRILAGLLAATWMVGASAANVAPSVSVTAPVANATFAGPATVYMSANATDTDGKVTRVDYYRGTTLIGSATVAPYAYSWANVVPGTYSITAKATDDQWAVSTSAPVTIVA